MKKKIPIGLRKIIEKELQGNEYIIKPELKGESLIRFNDADYNSEYYFEIHKINITGSNHTTSYTIKYKPCTELTNAPDTRNVNLPGFQEAFKKWISLIKEANKDSPIFDDYFTQTYYDNLEPDFNILDEDAKYRPFSINQQKRIIAFLDKAEKIIKEQEPEQTPDVRETINLIELTRTSITRSTKEEVIKDIRKIIAKGFKTGLKIGEKLLIEFTAELTKRLLIGH